MRYAAIILLLVTIGASAQGEELLPVMQNSAGVITSSARQNMSKRFAAANLLVGSEDETYATTVARAAAAVQTNSVAYTSTVAKAASALQPNSVSFTSSFVNVEAGTTTTVVVINGRVTQFNIP